MFNKLFHILLSKRTILLLFLSAITRPILLANESSLSEEAIEAQEEGQEDEEDPAQEEVSSSAKPTKWILGIGFISVLGTYMLYRYGQSKKTAPQPLHKDSWIAKIPKELLYIIPSVLGLAGIGLGMKAMLAHTQAGKLLTRASTAITTKASIAAGAPATQKLSTGAIVGIVAGCIAFVAAFILGIIKYKKYKKNLLKMKHEIKITNNASPSGNESELLAFK